MSPAQALAGGRYIRALEESDRRHYFSGIKWQLRHTAWTEKVAQEFHSWDSGDGNLTFCSAVV